MNSENGKILLSWSNQWEFPKEVELQVNFEKVERLEEMEERGYPDKIQINFVGGGTA